MHTHIKDVPDIARTSPTLSVVKSNPPNFLGLTAHNEKTLSRNRATFTYIIGN
jgi:hypothetical protein